MHLRRFTAIALVVAASALTASARADLAADKAAAEALFDEGKTLLKNGDAAAACPKFAESNRLDPGVGTLLYLGSCYERIDRLASAWATFREAAALARTSSQAEREKMAIAKADALEPLVPRLAIDVAAPVAGLHLQTDGKPVADATWGSSIPLDPGNHTVQAEAAGYKSVALSVALAKGDRKRLTVPALERDAATTVPPPPVVHTPPSEPPPSEPPPSAPPPPVSRGLSPAKIAGLSIAGVGVAGLVVGTVFGVRAFSLAASVNDACPSGPCPQSVKDDADASRTSGTISTVTFVVGGVLVATGAVLFLVAPKRSTNVGVRWVSPTVGMGSVGMALGGAF